MSTVSDVTPDEDLLHPQRLDITDREQVLEVCMSNDWQG